MKNSKIEWIGEIPEDWETIKGKYLFKQRIERGNEKELQLLSPTQKYGVVPQALYEKLSGMVAVKLKDEIRLALLKTIHKGDYCISLRSFQGGFEYSEYEGVVSPAYQVFYPLTTIAHGYYRYLFKTDGFISKINSFAMSLRDGKNIAFEDFGNSYIPFPPLPEQQKIAEFLDKKCEEIDGLIKAEEGLIEKLKEYKQSVITEAVTKGIRPARAMKNSGVEWIGEIPEDWTVQKLKYICTINSETLTEQTNPDVEINYVDIGSVNLANGITNIEEFKFADAPSRARRITRVGDVIISTVRIYLKAIAIVDRPNIIVSTGFCVLRAIAVNNRFLSYSIKSNKFTDRVSAYSLGINYPAINTEVLKEFYILMPTATEQHEIADYLDGKCAETDRLIALKHEKIEKLKEYKQSVIYEYVTGKKEV